MFIDVSKTISTKFFGFFPFQMVLLIALSSGDAPYFGHQQWKTWNSSSKMSPRQGHGYCIWPGDCGMGQICGRPWRPHFQRLVHDLRLDVYDLYVYIYIIVKYINTYPKYKYIRKLDTLRYFEWIYIVAKTAPRPSTTIVGALIVQSEVRFSIRTIILGILVQKMMIYHGFGDDYLLLDNPRFRVNDPQAWGFMISILDILASSHFHSIMTSFMIC